MTDFEKSKLLSQFPEIKHGTYVYSPRFIIDGKLTADRDQLFKKLGLKEDDSLFMGILKHTDNVFVIKEKTGNGLLTKIPETDSLITNQKSVYLISYTADCLPIFIFDPIKKVVAMVHAGWKGVLNKIALKTITEMEDEFGSKREDVLVYIGPAIGPCCYDDKTPEKFEMFKKYKNATEKRDGKYFIDIKSAAKQDLLEFGILPDHLEISEICTGCRDNTFASHHIEGAERTASNLSVIALV